MTYRFRVGLAVLGTAAVALATSATAGQLTIKPSTLALSANTAKMQFAKARVQRILAARNGQRLTRVAGARPATARPIAKVKKALPVFQMGGPVINTSMMTAFTTAMKGWTPLTQGATQGGPELVKLGGHLFLLATGSDKLVHAAEINAGALTIADQSWTVFDGSPNVPSLGEVTCANEDDAADLFANCAMLTTGGSAAAFEIFYTDGGLATFGTTALGGKNAGARPAVNNGYVYVMENGKVVTHAQSVVKAAIIVWDGVGTQYVRAGQNPWAKDGLTTASGFGCDSDCAFVRPDGKIGIGRYVEDRTLLAPPGNPNNIFTDSFNSKYYLETEDYAVPALSGGKNRLDYVERGGPTSVVQVGSDSALYRINLKYNVASDFSGYSMDFGDGWQKLGGWAKAGTTPSCVNLAGALTCAIQAIDGKIYIRRFKDGAAL